MYLDMASKTLLALIIVIIVIAGIAGYYLATRPAPTTTTPTTTLTETTTSPATTPSTEVKRILRTGWAFPTYIDPAIGRDFSSATAHTNIYDPLVWPTRNGSVKPWVAINWTVSDDGLVWTFKIRPGIKFHSGRELTAEDVAFSMKRLLTIGQGYAFIFEPYVEDAVALDKYTVQFKLKKTFGPFLIALTRLYIVDKEEVLAHIKKPGPYGEYGDFATEWMLYHDAGSGPYMVAEVKPEEYIRLVKFEDYWNKEAFAPYAPDEVLMLPTAGNPAKEMAMLAKRELEIGDVWVPYEMLAEMDKIEGVDIAEYVMPYAVYIMLNTKKPPLDDIHVRKALAYAFDYDAVIKEIFPGAIKGEGPIPKVLPGWCPVDGYERDLDKAIEELKKSKYYPDIVQNPDKYVIEFWWVAEVPAEEKLALLFAKCASEIGLKVKVVKTPWSKVVEYSAKVETSPHIFPLMNIPAYPDAAYTLEAKYHSSSAHTYVQNEWLLNETLDKWIESAISELDPEKRLQMYCEIHRYIASIYVTIVPANLKLMRPYQAYYVDWPQARDPSTVIPEIGYEMVFREIQVFPEKRAELLQQG